MLDTGYIYFENNVTLEGIEEAIIFIAYNDYFAAVWEQEFWISDLKVEVPIISDDPEVDPEVNPENTFIIPLSFIPILLALFGVSIVSLRKKRN